MAEALQDHASVISLSGVGAFLDLRGLWSEWERICHRAITAARATGDRPSEGRRLNNLGVVYWRQGRWDEAIAAYQQGLAIKREYRDRLGEGRTLNNLALLWEARGDAAQALPFARQAVAMLEGTEATAALAEARETLARLEGPGRDSESPARGASGRRGGLLRRLASFLRPAGRTGGPGAGSDPPVARS